MMRILGTAAVLIAAIAFEQSPAQAYEAPWCAVLNKGYGSVYWDCQYRSVEECAPHVIAGERGTCNPNPYFEGKPQKQGSRRRHKSGVSQ